MKSSDTYRSIGIIDKTRVRQNVSTSHKKPQQEVETTWLYSDILEQASVVIRTPMNQPRIHTYIDCCQINFIVKRSSIIYLKWNFTRIKHVFYVSYTCLYQSVCHNLAVFY